jgi:hypothetical protein
MTDSNEWQKPEAEYLIEIRKLRKENEELEAYLKPVIRLEESVLGKAQKEIEKLQRALEALTLVAKQLEADLLAERKKNETPSN